MITGQLQKLKDDALSMIVETCQFVDVFYDKDKNNDQDTSLLIGHLTFHRLFKLSDIISFFKKCLSDFVEVYEHV